MLLMNDNLAYCGCLRMICFFILSKASFTLERLFLQLDQMWDSVKRGRYAISIQDLHESVLFI